MLASHAVSPKTATRKQRLPLRRCRRNLNVRMANMVHAILKHDARMLRALLHDPAAGLRSSEAVISIGPRTKPAQVEWRERPTFDGLAGEIAHSISEVLAKQTREGGRP